MRLLKESFNAGEFTPRLYSRYELDKYKNGCKKLTNFVPLAHGPVARRPGTKYVASVKTASKFTRLIPFEFSEDDAYVLEFGDQYIRFFRNGGVVQGADADTVLLLHFDGANNSTSILDEGSTVHTVTANGDAKLKTATKKFGTASLNCDGDGDYISLPDHADFAFAGSEFTIDFRFYPTQTGVHPLYYQGDSGSGFDHILLLCDTTSDTIYLSVWDAGARTMLQKATSCGLSVSAWNHIVLVRGWGGVANDWAVAVGGTAVGTFTDATSLPDHDGDIEVGRFEGTTTTVDLGKTGHAVTFNNGAALSSDESKFGVASLSLDGTNDHLSIPDSADWDIGTNFTIDLFVKHTDHAGTESYVAQFSGSNNFWRFSHDHGNGLRFQIKSGGTNIVDTPYGGEITDTDWHHVALVKVGDEYGIYLDGIQVSYLNDSSMASWNVPLYIGKRGDGQDFFDGNMNNVRIQDSNVFSAAPASDLSDTITVPTSNPVPDANTLLLLPFDGVYAKGYIDEYRVSTTNRWTADFTPPSSQYPGGDDSGTTYEIATTYVEEDLPKLQYVQSADTMYIVHKDYKVRKLVRSAHATWAITDVTFTKEPSDWGANNYPRTVEFYEDRLCFGGVPTKPDTIWLSDVSDYVTFTGEVSITADTIAFVNSNPDTITDSGNGFVDAGFLAGQEITVKDSNSNNGTYTITNVTAGTLTLISTDSVTAEGAGATITIDAGTAADDESITLTLLARRVNDIAWMSAGKRLLVGTVGEEWWLAGPSDTEPITPSDKIAKRDSAWGSATIMPVNLGNIVFYLQQNGRILREMAYDYNEDAYVSSDLTVLAEHLTRTYKITDMAYQQHPYQILWCVRQDGTVLALTYLKEHQVVGWSKHDLAGGEVESVATISGDPEDEVWFVVKRTIDGSTVRYVERLSVFNYGTSLEDAFFVDCGLTYDGAPATTVSGLGHLEGESVAILADGAVVTGKTVSNGSITLSSAASKIHIGLAYTPELETLDAVTQDDDGTLQGVTKRITSAIFRLIGSMGGQFGPDSSRTNDIPYDDTSAPYTGWTRDLTFDEGHSRAATVYITSDEPYPLEVAAITMELEG